eukprot:GHRQ01037647.1.p1 GENE.GHRQ01037647.1~~GHRQ01037647.1.p1  ORF type:complete len:227 (+),score=35.17 GHRQ01037647.1:535-1215(+)
MLLPQLAEWLCSNYESNDTAQRLVDGLHTHLLVTMNPDGFAARKRENGNNVDLNRNFPDPIELRSTEKMKQPLPNAQPETVAMMKWTLETPFVASANLHEGAIVANYPFDGYPDHSEKLTGQRNPAPDDKAFQFFAKLYAKKHAYMAASKVSPADATGQSYNNNHNTPIQVHAQRLAMPALSPLVLRPLSVSVCYQGGLIPLAGHTARIRQTQNRRFLTAPCAGVS